MTYNVDWHRQYALLELAEDTARIAYRAARGRKKEAALETLRMAGKARWDYEMAGCTIVNIADLPVQEWARSLLPAGTR